MLSQTTGPEIANIYLHPTVSGTLHILSHLIIPMTLLLSLFADEKVEA